MIHNSRSNVSPVEFGIHVSSVANVKCMCTKSRSSHRTEPSHTASGHHTIGRPLRQFDGGALTINNSAAGGTESLTCGRWGHVAPAEVARCNAPSSHPHRGTQQQRPVECALHHWTGKALATGNIGVDVNAMGVRRDGRESDQPQLVVGILDVEPGRRVDFGSGANVDVGGCLRFEAQNGLATSRQGSASCLDESGFEIKHRKAAGTPASEIGAAHMPMGNESVRTECQRPVPPNLLTAMNEPDVSVSDVRRGTSGQAVGTSVIGRAIPPFEDTREVQRWHLTSTEPVRT